MNVDIPTPDEIASHVKDMIFEELEERMVTIMRRVNRPAYLSTNHLKDIGISYAKQQHMRDSGAVGYIQDNKKIIYPIEEFEKWAEEHSVNLKGLDQ